MQTRVNEKLKSAVAPQGGINAEHLFRVLKSDCGRLFTDYFEFDPRNLKIIADLSADGGAELTVMLKAEKMKNVGKVLD